MSTIIFILIVALAFYFILLRPVLQQQRRQRRDLTNLQVGDEVLTQAGFIARVVEIQMLDNGRTLLVLDLGNGLAVRAVPTAISQRLSAAQKDAPSPGGRELEGGGIHPHPSPLTSRERGPSNEG